MGLQWKGFCKAKTSLIGSQLRRFINKIMENNTPQDEIVNEQNPTAEAETATEEAPAVEQTAAELSETEKLQAEIAELKDKHLRLQAEFDNFRRRNAKERIELINNAAKDLIVSLLPVVDDFERAIKVLETSTDLAANKEGVHLVFSKFSKTLESKGLKAMEVKGEAFDVELHEAITQIPAPTEDLKGKVIDEVEKGFFLNDTVIRFAKVVTGA